MKRKRFSLKLIVSMITTFIILIVAFLAWPSSEKISQSNETDPTKTQFKIIVKRINIREDANIESTDIGDVYMDEIYTLIEYKEDKEYYWYKIKTNTGIEGYVGSSKKDEYVEFISGYLDRTAPSILYDKDYIVFNNGEENYDDIGCLDEFTTCKITCEKVDNIYVHITAVDEAGNKNEKDIKYYNVYDSHSWFSETNKNFSALYTRDNSKNKLYITATFTLNRQIPSSDKSSSYSTVVLLYDEDFNIINDINGLYNSEDVSSECINDNRMLIKEEYNDRNLSVTDKICFNYLVSDASKVKYFEIGIQGVENYESDKNYLANYSSKIYRK